jgi:hypothetical protein
MIRINGVPLDNPTLGWVYRSGSRPYSPLEMNMTAVSVAGRDGDIPAPSTLIAPLWPLKVNTPPSGWSALQALFLERTLTITDDDRPGKYVNATLATSSIDRLFTSNQWIDVTYVLKLNGAYWRDLAAPDRVFPLTVASETVEFWSGISAPVGDALIRLRGSHTATATITDASGAWLSFSSATASEWLVFDMATGAAGKNTNGSWAMTTDISGSVDYGGPRGIFEITSKRNVADPAIRIASLTVSRAAATAGELAVRGKAAYVF